MRTNELLESLVSWVPLIPTEPPFLIGAAIKADLSDTAEEQQAHLSEEDEWSDAAPVQQVEEEEEEINIVDWFNNHCSLLFSLHSWIRFVLLTPYFSDPISATVRLLMNILYSVHFRKNIISQKNITCGSSE